MRITGTFWFALGFNLFAIAYHTAGFFILDHSAVRAAFAGFHVGMLTVLLMLAIAGRRPA